MATIHGMRPSKLDEEMLPSHFGVWPKQLHVLKIRLENVEKNFFASKRIQTTLLLWQQWTLTIFHWLFFLKNSLIDNFHYNNI